MRTSASLYTTFSAVQLSLLVGDPSLIDRPSGLAITYTISYIISVHLQSYTTSCHSSNTTAPLLGTYTARLTRGVHTPSHHKHTFTFHHISQLHHVCCCVAVADERPGPRKCGHNCAIYRKLSECRWWLRAGPICRVARWYDGHITLLCADMHCCQGQTFCCIATAHLCGRLDAVDVNAAGP